MSGLSTGMRQVLLIASAVNVGGALTFVPLLSWGRQLLALPPADPLYLWMIAAWVLAFGVSFAHQALAGTADRGVLAIGAFGKLSFSALMMIWLMDSRVSWLALVAALIDAVLAMAFISWLWRSRVNGDLVTPAP